MLSTASVQAPCPVFLKQLACGCLCFASTGQAWIGLEMLLSVLLSIAVGPLPTQ